MKTTPKPTYVYKPGDHLRTFIKIASFGALFFSLFGTLLMAGGADSFNLPSLIWQVSAGINMTAFVSVWIFYLNFKGTDKLLGHGIISIFILFGFFWLFGVSMFYFYFIFAPINFIIKIVVVFSVSLILLYRTYLIKKDISEALLKGSSLYEKLYQKEGNHIVFTREAVGYLEAARPERSTFKSFHAFAAMAIAPFVLILNRVLSPVVGEAHGVFMVLAFFSVPMMLWGAGIVVQTFLTMIYYPITIYRATGQDVVFKNW